MCVCVCVRDRLISSKTRRKRKRIRRYCIYDEYNTKRTNAVVHVDSVARNVFEVDNDDDNNNNTRQSNEEGSIC